MRRGLNPARAALCAPIAPLAPVRKARLLLPGRGQAAGIAHSLQLAQAAAVVASSCAFSTITGVSKNRISGCAPYRCAMVLFQESE